ncbi:phosphatase PAP2 family protein [Xylocopilactobacillus apicola]|uniref:phosphatase PAP2 family protein n=1 Tax=Xylocopilactobacillus apicola TaxID=2932184 RepID=UPI003CE4DF84
MLTLVKRLIARPRPSARLVAESSFSFPSGHTFGSLLLVLSIFYFIIPLLPRFKRSLTAFLVVFFLFIIFSRVYLFVHYPSDILGGIFLTLFWWNFTRSKKETAPSHFFKN